jgi:hypothetical protein
VISENLPAISEGPLSRRLALFLLLFLLRLARVSYLEEGGICSPVPPNPGKERPRPPGWLAVEARHEC